MLEKVFGIKIHTTSDYLCWYFTLFIFHYQYLYLLTILKIGTVCKSALCYKITHYLTLYFYPIKQYIFIYNTNYNVKCNIFTNYFNCTKIVLFKQSKLICDISLSVGIDEWGVAVAVCNDTDKKKWSPTV